MNNVENNSVYIMFNGLCVLAAIFLLSLSVWLAPVDLSTKGYWGMGVIFLAGSLVNVVKYRMDDRINKETIARLEQAKNEKLLKEYVGSAA
jgi:hypothetical protein